MKRSASRGRLAGQLTEVEDVAPEDVPPDVIAQAKAAFGQRIGGEMALLVWDSLDDDAPPRRYHHLRFEHPRMQIDVSVDLASPRGTVRGVVYRAAPVRVELHADRQQGLIEAELRDGSFTFEGVPFGLARLRLMGPEEIPGVTTDWFRV
jgi:hypothetical protein